MPSSVRAAGSLIAAAVTGLLADSAVSATAKQDATPELMRALDNDELTRATIARRLGDEPLLDALSQTQDRRVRLAAVRCSPFLREPERALASLAAIASSRDPELAPAAGLRTRQIAQSLLLAERQERDLSVVPSVARSLVELSRDPLAPDALRTTCGEAAYLLAALRITDDVAPLGR
jgi:hypothetical protein